MRVVIQRVSEACVEINNRVRSSIGMGLLVFLGVEEGDTVEDIVHLAYKIARLRIFSDADGKMNLSVDDVNGQVMVISQFTLLASTAKGHRPSFTRAARPEFGRMMYEMFVKQLEKELNIRVATGEFGADMKVSLVNDGPVTIIMDSRQKDL
jgi:D-tyrosyl-tRNA(Tyr) deacylase